jgi:hypothetical protein
MLIIKAVALIAKTLYNAIVRIQYINTAVAIA